MTIPGSRPCPICGVSVPNEIGLVAGEATEQHRCDEDKLKHRDAAMKGDRCDAAVDRRTYGGRLRDAESFMDGG